ncbi:hypothetical protein IQ279_09390 [Streptomyces verrucosisporus]|uniref:hypothetical protein n=1 Tax=Streptomyces verrucosisporus TaxID=1695161 RepID=UPI0019D2E93F|nr:hypothetical protein [Streptomyces verrucosisporus]MBN3929850.1 hypothetical protein [Streptomyces verrucosisporus]
MRHAIRTAAACLAAALPMVLTTAPPAAAEEPAPRIDLRVLVVDDGGPAVGAITSALGDAGTPYTTVDLADDDRPTVDGDFLGDTVDGRPRARYQGVVLPNENPFGAGSAEMAALAAYEAEFGIRQVDAYTYAGPAVGLDPAQETGYAGPLDGETAQVTDAGRNGPFGYLDGEVPFEDNDPQVDESYGYLAVPLADPPEGASFTSYVDAPIPGSRERGSLVGEYTHDGRSELVVTFVYNRHQQQYRLLARGIVAWLTQGVHLGVDRNHFAVHVDDVLAADDRWHTELNCTPGDVDCGGADDGLETDPIRMTEADAAYAAQWSADRGFTLDMAFNGGGSDLHRSEHGSDPLAARMLADQASHRWINHTYNHLFLGCVQDVTVVPWRCATDEEGQTRWESQALITTQIDNNLSWADRNDLAVDERELVTGEHSGLVTLPQQPRDNPNLAPSLTTTGVTWIASDASREAAQRPLGPALTVPRYPMNIFYNAGRTAEQVDEYNWIYTRRSDGGSGLCEDSPATTTCLDAPLDLSTGYESYIVPLEARIALRHVMGNDPRPHFIHQSNLAEDRIAYPALDRILDDYADLFAGNTPMVNLPMRAVGQEMRQRAAWRAALDAGEVTAHRTGPTVTVDAPAGLRVPLTAPEGTVQRPGADGPAPAFGESYAGLRTGWAEPGGDGRTILDLPGAPQEPENPGDPDGPDAPQEQDPRCLPDLLRLLDLLGLLEEVCGLLTPDAQGFREPAERTEMPAGAAEPVPYGPGDTAVR